VVRKQTQPAFVCRSLGLAQQLMQMSPPVGLGGQSLVTAVPSQCIVVQCTLNSLVYGRFIKWRKSFTRGALIAYQ